MPELTPESTPPPAAVPPVVDPKDHERFPTFRETFLFFLTGPEINATFRAFGDQLFTLVLLSWDEWPDYPESIARTAMRAVLADLRHLQGFLLQWCQSESGLSEADLHLPGAGLRISKKIGEVADRLEKELAHGEA